MITIGVTAGFMPYNPQRKFHGTQELNFIETELAEFLVRDGIVPVLIPNLPLSKLRPLLHQMDGFVFQGMQDVAPETYWEKPLDSKRWQGDTMRDLYELEIMEFAIKQEKPVLGISRGFHLMNIYFGGTLYQDIQTQRPGSITHLNVKNSQSHVHGIEVTANSLFERFYSNTFDGKVNSCHHQGICEIGNQLEVWARCKEDQIIEAFSWSGAEEGKVMGVQWHPERLKAAHNDPQVLLKPEPIYSHFLKLSSRQRKKL